jgi:NAD(P)H-dependent FMN reductase
MPEATPEDLLVVWHPVPPSIASLRDAVLAGFADAATQRVVRSLAAPAASADDVESAAAAVLITTENFGMVSGLMKDFLERIYPWFEEVPDRRPGMPYLLITKGGNDGTGAVRDVTRILTGLRWKAVLPPLVVSGSVTDEHLAAAREQAATLAAGIDTGVF